MNSYTAGTSMQKELNFRCILKLTLLFLFTFHLISASAQFDEEPANKGLSKKKWPPVIHKLSEVGLPILMVKRIRKYTKLDMDSTYLGGEDYHESFAEKGDNDVFEDYVVKVMLRFVGGNIVGFIKKEPLMQSNQGKYEMTQINIPIEWCAVDSLKQEHCAKTPEEVKELDSVAKPQDWHQKLDPNELAENKVEDNFDLLQMLNSKSGRKKLKSKKLLDSLTSVATNLTGDDSVFAARRITQLQKEMQVAARKKKGIAALDDSTIASITTGLTGSDSINAIKTYVAEQKAQKDKKYMKAEKSLDSTTIASLTQGLSATDSVKAIRKYLLGAMATKRTKKTRGAPDKSNPAMALIPSDSTGVTNNAAVIAIKPIKADKKKKKGGELDENTIAQITNGLTGTDSINAIKEYKLIAKRGKDSKNKRGKPVEQVFLADSTSQQNQSVVTNKQPEQSNIGTPTPSVSTPGITAPSLAPATPAVASKPNKNDKKKKKSSDDLDDNTIATITKGLSGEDSVNAIRDYKLEAKKGKDFKKKNGNKKVEQVVSADTTTQSAQVVAPAIKVQAPVNITPITNTPKDTVATIKVVAPTPPPSNGRKRVIDSAAIKDIPVKDSAVITKPIVVPVETKPPVLDTIKQAALPPVVKDATNVAPPAVPLKNKSSRKKIVPVLPPTESTSDKLKAPADSSSTATKPAIDTLSGNKIVVPADTSKPR